MFCIKMWLFLGLLTISTVGAEEDIIYENAAVSTTTPSVDLQLSESKSSNENEISQSVSGNTARDTTDKSSDVEVFGENNGPIKENQEELEEAVEGDETPSEAQEPEGLEPVVVDETDTVADKEETETVAEPDPVAEDGNSTPSQLDEATVQPAEGEAATESVSNEMAENEATNEGENTKAEEQANDGTNTDEAEMPKDEPAREEETENPDSAKSVDTAALDKKEVFCFACNSSEDVKCAINATKEIKCPKAHEAPADKHNGCYTLYQADSNVTMRGCVDDLAEGGLKYCLTHKNLCMMCYSNGCNDKPAPSKATKLQLNIFTFIILNLSSSILIKYANLICHTF